MKKASEELRHDHELIKVALNVLEEMALKIERNENVDVNEMQEIVDFTTIFSDKCHHGKEEDFYFPSLEKAGIPNEGGPIGVMLVEHDQGRNNIREMRESVSGQNVELQVFAMAAFSYVSLMRNHIEKENNILFMMGDRFLSDNVQNELLTQFKEHEEKVIDEEKHKKLYELLQRFEEKYLSSSID